MCKVDIPSRSFVCVLHSVRWASEECFPNLSFDNFTSKIKQSRYDLRGLKATHVFVGGPWSVSSEEVSCYCMNGNHARGRYPRCESKLEWPLPD